VFLGEEKKGLISLSTPGSGLKTAILVLLNLLVVPEIEQKERSAFTFAFEELENNLHPALLRRLFRFLEDYAVKENATIFLTTHSSTATDVFGVSTNAQIIHVTHDGETARSTGISAHFDHLGVISELGAKPSDLLQANGIIWVEGPSDCVYLNRWLYIYSGGTLREGRDYLCAFYGGSLLSRTQFKAPEEALAELVNKSKHCCRLRWRQEGTQSRRQGSGAANNRRSRQDPSGTNLGYKRAGNRKLFAKRSSLKGNWCPRSSGPWAMRKLLSKKNSTAESYVETKMNRKGIDKMDLAILCAPHLSKDNMSNRFDWDEQMQQILERVSFWNR